MPPADQRDVSESRGWTEYVHAAQKVTTRGLYRRDARKIARERTEESSSINVPAVRGGGGSSAAVLESRGYFCCRVSSQSGGLIARITGLARVRGCL